MKKCKRYRPLPTTPPAHANQVSVENDAAIVEDYLDKIMAPLAEVLPYERRVELRNETRTQILSLAAAYQELGSTREDGIAEAIHRVNSSRSANLPVTPKRRPRPATAGQVARRDRWMMPSAKSAMSTALIGFSIASLLLLITANANPPLDLFILFLAPLFVGFVTGLRSRERPVLGTLLAWVVALAATYVLDSTVITTSRIDWPTTCAQIQTYIWLPISLVSAWAAAKFRPQIIEALGRWGSEQEMPLLPEPSSPTNGISRP